MARDGVDKPYTERQLANNCFFALTPIATSVVSSKVIYDESGSYIECPSVITEYGESTTLADYFVAKRNKSISWMKSVAWSYELFIQYFSLNRAFDSEIELFQRFALHLHLGTINLKTGYDETGLGWKALGVTAATTATRNLTALFDWIVDKNPNVKHINPVVVGDSFEKRMNLCAYQHRRSKAMLGNTWLATKEEIESARMSGRQRKGTTENKEPPSFPEEHFERLLLEGFRVGKKHSLREILIVLLLHCGGFRESEPFHLFAGDVIPDPDNYLKAMVLIHHPQRGLAPSDWRDEKGRPIHGTRRDYLQAKFGMLPRNEILGTRHAGWKPRIHEAEYGSEFLRTYWFEPWWGEFFLAVWYKYLAQILLLERKHPFAFVNIGRAPIGDMYKVGKFNDAHADAVSRIGLEVSKAAGTTPHGHRHAYAQRLRKGKVDENLVRRAMHHSSVASQEIYTAPSLEEVMKCLQEATANLDRSASASASSHKLMEILIH